MIEECLKNYKTLKIMGETNMDVLDICIDIKTAIAKVAFTDDELKVLYYFTQGYNYSETQRASKIYRLLVPMHLANICEKLACFLGGEYITKLGETK